MFEGAEAKIYLTEKNTIIKERISKKYRIKELDEKLRKHRTKAEAKILKKAHSLGINTPQLLKQSKYSVKMEYIEGIKLRQLPPNNLYELIPLITEQISLLHQNDIIHGDLTTSNLILKNNKIYIIDFGLSYISKRIEDKATDLRIFFETLLLPEKIKNKIKNEFIKSYNSIFKDALKITEHLKSIEKRGRYKKG